jgi:hypothetical protein
VLNPTSQATDHGARFQVVVNSAYGSVTSAVAVLTVLAAPVIPTNAVALWLRADAGVSLSGGAVAQWNDFSGNNRHAAQAVAVSRPTLKTAAVGGLPAVRFDGLNDFLTFNLPVNGLTGLSLFLVASSTQVQNPGTTQAENAALFWNETASWGTVYLSPFQSAVHFRFGTTQIGNRTIYQRPSSAGSGFTLTEAIKNATVDSLFVNGAQVVSQSGKLPAIAGCRTLGNIARGYNDNTYFGGDIAEVLIFDRALTAAERISVEFYLLGKYGLSAAGGGAGGGLASDAGDVPDTAPLELAVDVSARDVVVSWPLTTGSWVLQETDSLGEPGAWSDVIAPVTVWNGRNQMVLPVIPSQRFFRLVPLEVGSWKLEVGR